MRTKGTDNTSARMMSRSDTCRQSYPPGYYKPPVTTDAHGLAGATRDVSAGGFVAQIRREKERAYQHEYHQTHREQIAPREREYKKTNCEKMRAQDHERYLLDPEKKKAQSAAYLQLHPEVKRASNLAYSHLHPDKARVKAERRRALKYGNTPIDELLTEAQWRDILDQYHHRCAYCGRKMDKLTIDHVIPLAKGGTHSANNVVPACQHCNSVKNARTPEQWVGMKVCHV